MKVVPRERYAPVLRPFGALGGGLYIFWGCCGMRMVVKVGTSLLTRGDGRLNLERMAGLVRQMAGLYRAGWEVVLVTSGAVGVGVGRLGLKERPADMAGKQALAAVGQGILMQVYEQLFSADGLNVAQVLLTREDLEDSTRSNNARATLQRLLGWGVVPIINENDTVAYEEIKVGDNDTLSARVAVLTGADLLVILSDVAGLYPADPRLTPGLLPLSAVYGIDDELIERAGGGPGNAGGTGGMRTKLLAARIVGEAGIPMALASGHRPEVLPELAAAWVGGGAASGAEDGAAPGFTWFYPEVVCRG